MSRAWTRYVGWLRLPFLSREAGNGRWVEPSNELLRSIFAGPILLPAFDVVARPVFAGPVEAPAPAYEPVAAPAHVFEDDSFEEPAAATAPIPFPGRAA